MKFILDDYCGSLSDLVNFNCDTYALFVFKVHVEKINALTDTISRQMANFEKICKICCGKSQGFLSPQDSVEKNPS